LKFAPMRFRQWHCCWDILIEPAARRRAAIEAQGHSEWGRSELGAQSGRKNQPACLTVCDVGVYCGQGWMDQDEAWHAGRPRPRQHCVRWGPSSPKGAQPPIFGPCPLWPNGWMNQDATWYRGKPRPRRHCVKWGPSYPQKGHSPQFSVHVRCG